MRNHPRILLPPTQLQNFIKISRTGFPGNRIKNFISIDSEKNRLLGIQPKYKSFSNKLAIGNDQ